MDVISDVLQRVNLSSAIYFKSDFASPWGMKIDKGPFAQFHYVTRGQCILKIGNRTLNLFSGDVVVFPHGTTHWIADNKKSALLSGMDVVQSIKNGKSLFSGKEISTTLICGHFELDKNVKHPLMQELPDVIHIPDKDRKSYSWLRNITELVSEESGNEMAGSELIVKKLGEVLFLHTLRAYSINQTFDNGIYAALKDDRIQNTLKAIHQSPGSKWDLIELAKIAGMSRTAYCNRFKELMGNTPFNYIKQWRIIKAKELLAKTQKSVSEVSEEIGYQSEAAFSRVFKQSEKLSPQRYRQSKTSIT